METYRLVSNDQSERARRCIEVNQKQPSGEAGGLARSAYNGWWHVVFGYQAMMGMTMAVGIVMEVAIFYFSEYGSLFTSGQDAQN